MAERQRAGTGGESQPEQSESGSPITPQQLIEAYALSTATYLATQDAFIAKPTIETMHAFHLAADRFMALRAEVCRGYSLADAIDGSRKGSSS